MSDDKLGANMEGSGDGQLNLCEMVASFIDQRESLQRLLDSMRNSQTNCEDTHCLDDITNLGPSSQDTQSTNTEFFNMVMLVMCLILAVLTFARAKITPGRHASNANSKTDREPRTDDDDHYGNYASHSGVSE